MWALHPLTSDISSHRIRMRLPGAPPLVYSSVAGPGRETKPRLSPLGWYIQILLHTSSIHTYSQSRSQSPLQVACPLHQHSPTRLALDLRIAPRIASVSPFRSLPRRGPPSLFSRPWPATPTHHGLRIIPRSPCFLAEAHAGPPPRPGRVQCTRSTPE